MTIFHFKDTPENRAHADAIKETMKRKAELTKAQTTLMKSKAALPWLLGCSALVLSAGVGGGVAQWGYSYIVGNKVIAQQVTEGVKAVLDTEVITAKLADGGEVSIKDGGEVALKAPALVSLDPNSALLRVVGQAPADVPRLTPERAALPASKAGVFTNFTVFKVAKFGAGEVHTAWEYKDGDQERPSRQFCEYTQFTVGTNQNSVELGWDGRMKLAETAPAGLDLRAAYEKCVWWTESAPVTPPSTSAQTTLTRAAKR
jgi:hypothetical protein